MQLSVHIFVLVALKLFLIHYCIIFDNNFKVFNKKKTLKLKKVFRNIFDFFQLRVIGF